MWAVYKLRARTYFHSPSAYMLIFIALIYLAIFGTIVGTNFGDDPIMGPVALANVFGIILTLLIMSSASYQFGFEFLDMKKSVLLRRIGASKVNKSVVVGSFILWALTVLMIVVVFVFFLIAIFSSASGLLPKFNWKTVNYFGLFVAIIIGAIGSYVIAFFFVALSNDTDTYNICTTLFFFASTALGGLFGGGAHWMYIIGHLTPIGWTADLIQGAMNGDAIFHLGGYVPNMMGAGSFTEWGVLYNENTGAATYIVSWRATMDLIAPLIIAILAGGVALKKFKWD